MSSAEVTLARSWLRRNAITSVAIGLILALAVGTAMAAFAGARRSSTALDRFLDAHRPATAMVGTEAELPPGFDWDLVETAPGVVGSTRGAYGLMAMRGPTGVDVPLGVVNPFITARAAGVPMSQAIIASGRAARPHVASEVTLDEFGARLLEVDAGDRVTLHLYAPQQMEGLFSAGADFPAPLGATTEVTVTGIHRTPVDLNPVPPEDVYAVALASAEMHLGPAFWDEHGDQMAAYGGLDDGTDVLLADGLAGLPAFEDTLRALPGGELLDLEARSDARDAVENARATVRFEALASAAFGVVLLLAVAAVAGQALARQVRAELRDRPLLLAIGMRPRALVGATVLRFLPVGLIGACGSVAVAWASSDRVPIGLGGRAEIESGRSFDVLVSSSGAATVLGVTLLWTAHAARRTATTGGGFVRAGLLDQVRGKLAAAGAPATLIVGMGQLTTRDRAQLPVRSSLAALFVAVAGVTAVLVFTTSLASFVDRPEAQGWAWDVVVGDADADMAGGGVAALAGDPAVTGFAAVSRGMQSSVVLGEGRDVNVVAVDSLAGGTGVRVVSGRPPDGPGEVILGARDMVRAGLEVGDVVPLASPLATADFEVVGVGLMNHGLLGGTRLDEGAVVSGPGLERLFPSDGEPATRVAHFLVEFDASEPLTEVLGRLRDEFGPTVIPHVRPVYAAGLDGARILPVALGAFVGLLGTASLIHFLLLLARRRRHELAVLSALGAERRQLRHISLTAGATLAALSLLIGVPLGLAGGAWVWRIVATGVGAQPSAGVPVLLIGVLAVGVLAMALLSAAVPTRLASAVRPGAALRSE